MNTLRDSKIIQALSIIALVISIAFAANWNGANEFFENTAKSIRLMFIKNLEFSLGVTESNENTTYDIPYASSFPRKEVGGTDSYTVTIVITQTQNFTNQNAQDYRYEYKENIVYPTYSYPTKTDSQKAWDEEFQRKWDEMRKYNEMKNKEVQDAQKKFCEENPDLCNK